MDYAFENLGEDRFQEFCQALMLTSFRGIQCFPIRQRDGGRDFVDFGEGSAPEQYVVYQVKFKRKPYAEVDPHKWLLKVLETELPKISKLIDKGATEYILITNVPATGYLDSGSIDTANDLLEQHIPIKSQCLWREDISRRLETVPQVRWSYTELLTGVDALKIVLEGTLRRNALAAQEAISRYLAEQYSSEERVLFQQIDLQSKLIDVFIDIPFKLRDSDSELGKKFENIIDTDFRDIEDENLEGVRSRTGSRYGSARAVYTLLNEEFCGIAPVTVIEGGPGQGKSTLSQYICQLHRIRLLQKESDLRKIPIEYLQSSVQIPFRVDLKELAVWLDGKDPFSDNSNSSAPLMVRSVESFISYQIQYYSGGMNFDVTNLSEICRENSVLFVFDGLDEVAEIYNRSRVVKELKSCINRLLNNCKKFQCIITSRPCAFENSPGLSVELFPRFSLARLSRKEILQYARKWTDSKKLSEKQASSVVKVLEQRLEHDHIGVLASNPMQLSILLSLILTKGASLPDKRTALYDNYVSIFFDRESEKNELVRENRDLLLGIHKCLGWMIHSRTETGEWSGRISKVELNKLIQEYIENWSTSKTKIPDLLPGVVERIVMIVSRLEGTFEFEIQPLREYFAARYLYDFAPYAYYGSEVNGTIPDRFRALSKNYYWLNVSRFFAGCYSAGELPSLVDCLVESLESKNLARVAHSVMLAIILIKDWLFQNDLRSMSRLVASLTEPNMMRLVLCIFSHASIYGEDSHLEIPSGLAKKNIVDLSLKNIETTDYFDQELEICNLLRLNCERSELLEWWSDRANSFDEDRLKKWLSIGVRLGLISSMPEAEVERLLDRFSKDHILSVELYYNLFQHSKYAILERYQERFDRFVKSCCTYDLPAARDSSPLGTASQFVSQLFRSDRYTCSLRKHDQISLASHWNNLKFSILRVDDCQNSEVLMKYRPLIEKVFELADLTLEQWNRDPDVWNELIEYFRTALQIPDAESSYVIELAVRVADSRIFDSHKQYYQNHCDLFEHSDSLLSRILYAKSKMKSRDWWHECFSKSQSDKDRLLCLTLFFQCGRLSDIGELVDVANKTIGKLSTNAISDFRYYLKMKLLFGHSKVEEISAQLNLDNFPEKLLPESLLALHTRLNSDDLSRVVPLYLSALDLSDPDISMLVQRYAFREMELNPNYSWLDGIDLITESYKRSKEAAYFSYFSGKFAEYSKADEKEIWSKISYALNECPSYLLYVLIQACKNTSGRNMRSIRVVSESEGWFIPVDVRH